MGEEADCEGAVAVAAIKWPTLAIIPPNAIKPSIKQIFRKRRGSCIYFLTLGNECVYIGETIRLSMRVGMHAVDKDFDSVYYFNCPDSDRKTIERELITEHRPRLNAQLYGAKSRVKVERLDIGGDASSTRKKVHVRLSLPEDVWERLQRLKAENGSRSSWHIINSIHRYLDEVEPVILGLGNGGC